MFPDLFAPNAVCFALGCAAAIGWLRTGMTLRGGVLLALVLIAADVALVARFVYGEIGVVFGTALVLLQAGTAFAVGWWALQAGRRLWSPDRARRGDLFAQATRHYLRGEWGAAAGAFARVHRLDPWDVAATIGLANVAWRNGQSKRALRLLQCAKSLDRKGVYVHLIGEQARRVRALRPSA